MKNLIKLLSLLLALSLCLTACQDIFGGNETPENENENNNDTAETPDNTENKDDHLSIIIHYEKLFEKRYGIGMHWSLAKVKINKIHDVVYTGNTDTEEAPTEYLWVEITLIEDYFNEKNSGVTIDCLIAGRPILLFPYEKDPDVDMSIEKIRKLISEHEYFIVNLMYMPFAWGDVYLDGNKIHDRDETIFDIPMGKTAPNSYLMVPITDGHIDLDSINDFYKSEGIYDSMTTNDEIEGFFVHSESVESAEEKIYALRDTMGYYNAPEDLIKQNSN